MKKTHRLRKALAWALCLVMLTMLALPVLADEPDPAPAPAAAPAKDEAPAAKDEVPVAKDETPAVKDEAPAADEAPAKEDTPAADEAAPKEDAPAQDETPAKDEAPASETPAEEPEEQTATVAVPSAPRRPAATRPAVMVEEEPEADEPTEISSGATFVPSVDIAAAGNGDTGDGFTVDWDEVGTLKGGDWQVSQWGLARGEGGYYVYMENAQNQTSIGITYYGSASDAIRWRGWIGNGSVLVAENELPIDGATLTVINEGGSYRMEGFIPDKFFKETSFILSSGNVTLASEDIPLLPGATAPETARDADGNDGGDVPAQAPDAAYAGIVIDGDFADWDAVPRYDIKDEIDVYGNVKNYDTVDHFSVVWDGDMVYILLVADGDNGAGNWNSVCGAGPSNNGQFAIVTDLNQQLLIQPAVVNGQPAVNGIDGAQAAVNNTEWYGAPHMWELAIPASALPTYLESFDFGFYLCEPALKGVTDLQGGGDEGKGFNGIVIDGKYADWTYYPMTTIEYATTGTQESVRDAHGALWADDSTLYGYVATSMPAHLEAKGGEFMDAITLAFNGDRSYKEYPTDGNFYPRILSFDSGAPVVLNNGTRLENGDYTFYIYDTRTDPTAPIYDPDTNTSHTPTMDELKQNAFGTIKVHVDGVLDQAEFELDMEKVAAYIEKDGDTAFKTIEIQWGRLGQQWISYAGTPTGPILSVALLVGAVGAPACYCELKRRRGAKKAKDGGEAK